MLSQFKKVLANPIIQKRLLPRVVLTQYAGLTASISSPNSNKRKLFDAIKGKKLILNKEMLKGFSCKDLISFLKNTPTNVEEIGVHAEILKDFSPNQRSKIAAAFKPTVKTFRIILNSRCNDINYLSNLISDLHPGVERVIFDCYDPISHFELKDIFKLTFGLKKIEFNHSRNRHALLYEFEIKDLQVALELYSKTPKSITSFDFSMFGLRYFRWGKMLQIIDALPDTITEFNYSSFKSSYIQSKYLDFLISNIYRAPMHVYYNLFLIKPIVIIAEYITPIIAHHLELISFCHILENTPHNVKSLKLINCDLSKIGTLDKICAAIPGSIEHLELDPLFFFNSDKANEMLSSFELLKPQLKSLKLVFYFDCYSPSHTSAQFYLFMINLLKVIPLTVETIEINLASGLVKFSKDELEILKNKCPGILIEESIDNCKFIYVRDRTKPQPNKPRI